MKREALQGIIDALKEGKALHLSFKDFPCLDPFAYDGKSNVSPEDLLSVVDHLSPADIPTFERALAAIDTGELAWLGFKIVYDADAAVRNVDNEVTKKYGEQGSADGEPLVFFCNDAKEIVASRAPSPRDAFQMKDVTRGPSMHNEQFDGLTWASVPLFDKVCVWLLGASDVACEVSALAQHVGFSVRVADYDPAFLTAERFPGAELVPLAGGDFHELYQCHAKPQDFVCVLTRGHMFDPDGCVWATRENAHYVGMMGCKGKNETVHDLVIGKGATEEQWQRVKRPIGIKFGAKTPAELAISIVAELVDERYKVNYSQAARDAHEAHLDAR